MRRDLNIVAWLNGDKATKRAGEMYGRYRFGHFYYSDQRPRFHPTLISLLHSCSPGQKVCDVGCGHGYWVRYLAGLGNVRGEDIVAVDIAPENIEELREEGFTAMTGDAAALDLPSGEFDLTISSGVIHHTPDYRKSFSELVRVTKPGGIIYVSVYNLFHPYFWLVHRLLTPVRWFYWHVSKKIARFVYYLALPVAQPVFLFRTGRFAPRADFEVHLMDQVFTPRAHLFTDRRIRELCVSENVEIIKKGFVHGGMMREVVLRVR